jgi:group I intron endonuclease
MDLTTTSGIYLIENTITSAIYIGQTSNIRYRIRKHFELLRINKHKNSRLQRAFNKYGESAFQVHVLNDGVSVDLLDSYEQTWLDLLREYPKEYVYNMCFEPNTTRGYKFTDQQRLEQSKRLTGIKKKSIDKYGAATKRKWELGIMKHKPKKTFTLVSPDGVIYEAKGLTEFAQRHGLSAGMVSLLISGKVSTYKQWTKF